MAVMDFSKTHFIKSAHLPDQWLPDRGAEVAFAGRSNVGKSSAINAITNRKGLAKTSKTPGRTQQINFFEVEAMRRIVDLPGYGFANVPDRVRKHWAKSIEQYLAERRCLRGLVLPMDSRRPLTDLDLQMLEWCESAELDVHILLTKADKLKSGKMKATVNDVQRAIGDEPGISIQSFSAVNKTGITAARGLVAKWLAETID